MYVCMIVLYLQILNLDMCWYFLLQCMKVKSESEVTECVQLSVTPWTAAYQAPPSMGFSRQKYWSGVPLFNINSDLSEGQPGRYRSPNLHHFYTGFYCLLPLLLSAGHQDIICLATSNELLRVLFRGKIKFLLRSNKRLQYL